MVYDTSLKWNRTEFHPRDAICGENVIPGGWKHEHCNICWETIAESAERFGYCDQYERWVCESCYENYIVPKKINFIPPPNKLRIVAARSRGNNP